MEGLIFGILRYLFCLPIWGTGIVRLWISVIQEAVLCRQEGVRFIRLSNGDHWISHLFCESVHHIFDSRFSYSLTVK